MILITSQVTTSIKAGKEMIQRSFVDVLTGNKVESIPLNSVPMLRIEGDNITVQIDEGGYRKGIEDNQFSVVGRLGLHKGDLPPYTFCLKQKLALI